METPNKTHNTYLLSGDIEVYNFYIIRIHIVNSWVCKIGFHVTEFKFYEILESYFAVDVNFPCRRDVADIAGLTTYAFGTEDVDRHVMVFKKEYPLTENELDAYRNGEEWDPEKAKEAALLVWIYPSYLLLYLDFT